MSWHSDKMPKKMRPGIGKLACLLLASIVVIVALAFGAGAAAAEEPTPTPPPHNLLVDGKEGAEVETYFEVSCVKPCDSGSEPIVLTNIGTDDGVLLFRITDLADEENGFSEPESVVDSTPDEGELGDNLFITISADGSLICGGYVSELQDRWQLIGPLPSMSGMILRICWSVDCDVGNLIQTDSTSFDMDFLLEYVELTNLVVPEQGYYCEEIPISVDVHNPSPLSLTFDLTMVITDQEGDIVYRQMQTVTVGGGETVTVPFTWHPIEGGTLYTVTIDGLSDTIEVLSPPPPTPPPGGGGGGGGGLPRRFWLDVDMWGKVTSGERTAFGILVEVIEAVSEDGMVTLLIGEGTEVLDLEGNPISRITVEPVEQPPPLPPNSYAINSYDFTPQCTFDPAIELTMMYNEEALPEGFDEVYLVIQYYDEESGEWREIPTVVDTYANTASVVIAHLTVFAVVASVPPPELTIASLSVYPSEVDPGESVTITVEVTNTGTTTGSRTIELWIEGEFEDSREVTLAAGATETVTFTASREEEGVYRVAVDGFRGEFEVVAPGFNYWPLIGGLLGGLLLAGGLTYLLLRWRAAERKRQAGITGGPL